MDNNDQVFLEKCLDAIEEMEARLLIWGIVDVKLSKDEFREKIGELLDKHEPPSFIISDKVIDALLEFKCIFQISVGEETFYRSRMAETVRLIFHLRQMFPKHSKSDDWQRAPTLVSDFRFIRRTRYFPTRSINIEDAKREIRLTITDQLLKNAFEEILDKKSNNFYLAKFQLRASKRILTALEDKKTSGTIISAGTGSGKTYAFYFPALAKIASNVIVNNSKHWMQCLSLYPRIELLKNQISDLFTEARNLDQFLIANNSRKILIGALYGDVPENRYKLVNVTDENDNHKWVRNEDGFVCPFLKCPNCACDLVWPHKVANDEEILRCMECELEISSDEIVLTRERMRKDPPDILFSTTEMLNQNLSSAKYYKLFGVNVNKSKKPSLLLMDEIHTYESFHGAQVSFLIKRWRNMVKAPMTVVGLSATLKDGERFFSRLTSVYQTRIQDIKPQQNELDRRGSEYLLAVKGDPVSQTALLSTTIQISMLVSRMLDPVGEDPSQGFFGQRVFAFTDDLDVSNRLFFQLLDVEGRSDNGYPIGGKNTLASLRNQGNSVSRFNSGQDWRIPDYIHHDLNIKKDILRVSSQDPGFLSGKDIVVATASLEVGIDDEHVGAVIQHKKPRGSASFLQRNGRAGRSAFMRPWTIVVLSDYGQDRIAYQGYEHLFDPEIMPSTLPLESRFIHHIQAVYVLMEFVAFELKQNGKSIYDINIWKSFSSPTKDHKNRQIQKDIIEVLKKILKDHDYEEKLEIYISKAIPANGEFNDYELSSSVMWEHPRPLMTVVIPTILRRLETNWGANSDALAPKEGYHFNSPLPEFAPSTLFGELNLPEVSVLLPKPKITSSQSSELETGPNEEEAQETETKLMPILKAMKTFAPGRISKRFAVSKSKIRHWMISEGYEDGITAVDIDKEYTTSFAGDWNYIKDDHELSIPVYRPLSIKVNLPPKDVQDTSNAQLNWRTEFSKPSDGEEILIPKTGLSPFFKGINVFTHGQQNPIFVRRFSEVSHAEIRKKNEDPTHSEITFEKDGQAVALGFELSVDSIEFNVSISNEILETAIEKSKSCIRAIRGAVYKENVMNGHLKSVINNPFLREWLGNVYLYNLIFQAIFTETSLEEANEFVKNKQSEISFSKVLEVIFQSHSIDTTVEEDEDEVTHLPSQSTDKLRQNIEELIEDPDTLEILHNEAQILYTNNLLKFNRLIKEKIVATLAGATFNAFQYTCPDVDTEAVILDIYKTGSKDDEDSFTFNISEVSPGGIGIIDEFITNYSEDPRNFFFFINSNST